MKKKGRKLTVVEVATLVSASTTYLQSQAVYMSVCQQMEIDPAKPFNLSSDGVLTQE